PRPPTLAAKDQPAVARGKTLFEGKAGCVACHSRTAFDDGKSHDVGTRGATDVTDRFDTPALRGVARTAPYLHDGRAKTLEAIFPEHNPKANPGAAHLLRKEELADLTAYLKSLYRSRFPTNFPKPSSVTPSTPTSRPLSSLRPPFPPATTKSVFFDTLP